MRPALRLTWWEVQKILAQTGSVAVREKILQTLDPIEFYPVSKQQLIRSIVARKLGVYRPPVGGRGLEGGSRILVKPPEGVLAGESVPVENDRLQMEENYLKRREKVIKTLERTDALKKEVD